MKTFNVEKHNILNIVELHAAENKEEKGVCEVTQAHVKYLFTVRNAAGETKNVSAGVIKAALIAQGATEKEAQAKVDKLYNVAYYDGKSTGGKTRITNEEKADALNSFLG